MTMELREELEEKTLEELEALCASNGLDVPPSATKEDCIDQLMKAAKEPLPPQGEVGTT